MYRLRNIKGHDFTVRRRPLPERHKLPKLGRRCFRDPKDDGMAIKAETKSSVLWAFGFGLWKMR